MTIEHRTTRPVSQPPAVVRDRLLELATRIRDEMPPIASNDQVAKYLGVDGDLGVEIRDGGPGRIDVATTRGRIRARGSAELTPTNDGGTALTLGIGLDPDGFVGQMMLSAATTALPNFDRQFHEMAERGATELAEELSKPDGEWSADGIVGRLSK